MYAYSSALRSKKYIYLEDEEEKEKGNLNLNSNTALRIFWKRSSQRFI